MPADGSFLSFYYRAMGPLFTLALLGSAALSVILTLYFLIRGRGALAGGAMLLAALLPFLIGLYGTFDGAIAVYRVIVSSTSWPKPSEFADGASSALATTLVGLLFSLPAIFIAVIGSVGRTFVGEEDNRKE